MKMNGVFDFFPNKLLHKIDMRDNVEEGNYYLWDFRDEITDKIWKEREHCDYFDIIIENSHYSGATSGALSG